MDNNGSDSPWVVVTSDGQNYMGAVARAWKEDTALEYLKNDVEDKKKRILLGLWQTGWLTLMPAYEFYCPMGRNEQGQMSRQAMLTHPDFVIANKKVPLHLRISKLYFFEDLDEHDRTKYKAMIKQADEMLEATLKQARAQAAGLTLVPGSGAPRDPRKP